MNLVVGSTGMLGMEICRQLRRADQPVRAMVRRSSDPKKRAELQRIGAELVEADLRDPASLAPACAEVRCVISTASSTFSRQPGDSIQTVDELGQLALIDAAQNAAADRFVYVSFRDNPGIQYPLTRAKRTVERHLIASWMGYTILQASYFMEVWLTPALGFDAANGKARIYGAGANKLQWVSYQDVARIAVAAVEEPRSRNTILNVGGPEALSPREVLAIFESVTGKSIAAEFVPESALRAQFEAATDPMQQSFAGLMLQYASGDAMDTSRTTELFPLRLTSVRDYASTVFAPRQPAAAAH